MKIKDSLKLSLIELRHSKLRTWLTIIGIVIGIAAVVSIVSVGNGLQATVNANLAGLGADTITIQTGFNRAAGAFNFRGGTDFGAVRREETAQENLTAKDLSIAKSVPNIKYIMGMVSGRKSMLFSGESSSVSIKGVDPIIWKLITTSELESGRLLSSGDSNSIVIGKRVSESLFKKTIKVNSQVSINDRPFSVVGILAESGSLGGDDYAIFMSIETARSLLGMDSNQLSSIQIKAADTSLVGDTVTLLEQKLRLSRHVTEATQDFTVFSPLSIQQTVSQITSGITFFLGGIAGISLLVGAIGISNTMYMSVTERKKQIGILKALGATNREVMKLFLLESSMLGLIGGLIGITVGSLVSMMISGIGVGISSPGVRGAGAAGAGGIQTLVSPELLIFAVLFSMAIGILSGIFPARQASKLQPVDILRSE